MVGGLKIAIALLLMLLMMVAAAVEFRGRGETLNDHPHKKACFAPLNDRTEQKGGSRRAALAAILSGSEPHHGIFDSDVLVLSELTCNCRRSESSG
mmetsp:Transcript_52624/g.163300  ORF Transcript_52624/g.163300 Transcript_52624/m.163300 type:complete len:96 (-) Transcript_52624:562-849(-)